MNHRFIFLLLYLLLFHEITIEARKGRRSKDKLTQKDVSEEECETEPPKKTTKKKPPEKTNKPEKPRRKRLSLFKPKILVRRKTKPPDDPCDDHCECREPKTFKACATTYADSNKAPCICPEPLTPFHSICPSFPGAGMLPCLCDEDGENVIAGMFGRVFSNFATKIKKYEQEYQLRKRAKVEEQRSALKKKIKDNFRRDKSCKEPTFSGRKCKKKLCKVKEKKPSLFAMKAPKRLGRKEHSCRMKSPVGREQRVTGMISRGEKGRKMFQARTMRTKGSR